MQPALSRRLFRCGVWDAFLIIALVMPCVPLAAAQPEWRLLDTPRFSVLSQLGDKPTRAWAEEFNQFIEELQRVFQAERDHLPPLTVLLFARDRDFGRYKPLRSDGRGPAPVGGFFNHYGNWSVIGLADDSPDEATRELIFHEGVHWFMSADPAIYPLWLAEGMAEVFSTFRQEHGKVRWGTDIPAHVELLRTTAMVPFERFLFTPREDPLFNRAHRAGIYYAQSWVFVHYLLFGEHDGSRDAIGAYFSALGKGMHPDEAFRAAFGHDYDRMGATLAGYIRTGRYYKVTRPESPAGRIKTSSAAAPAATVEVALGRLALASLRSETARAHAERAVEFAPHHSGGYELLGQLHHRAGDLSAAREACARAEQLGSQDAQTLFLLAYLTAADAFHRGGLPETTARAVADLYRRSIAACPTLEDAYRNLAALAPSLGVVEESDLVTLQQGARRFARNGAIVLGLASLVARRGDRTTARSLLMEARSRGLPVDDERRARRLEDAWLYDETSTQLTALMAEERFDDARVLCDEVMGRISDVYVRGSLVRLRQTLAVRARIAAAEQTWRQGDPAAARVLCERMLVESGIAPNLRREIEEILRRLPPAPVVVP